MFFKKKKEYKPYKVPKKRNIIFRAALTGTAVIALLKFIDNPDFFIKEVFSGPKDKTETPAPSPEVVEWQKNVDRKSQKLIDKIQEKTGQDWSTPIKSNAGKKHNNTRKERTDTIHFNQAMKEMNLRRKSEIKNVQDTTAKQNTSIKTNKLRLE